MVNKKRGSSRGKQLATAAGGANKCLSKNVGGDANIFNKEKLKRLLGSVAQSPELQSQSQSQPKEQQIGQNPNNEILDREKLKSLLNKVSLLQSGFGAHPGTSSQELGTQQLAAQASQKSVVEDTKENGATIDANKLKRLLNEASQMQPVGKRARSCGQRSAASQTKGKSRNAGKVGTSFASKSASSGQVADVVTISDEEGDAVSTAGGGKTAFDQGKLKKLDHATTTSNEKPNSASRSSRRSRKRLPQSQKDAEKSNILDKEKLKKLLTSVKDIQEASDTASQDVLTPSTSVTKNRTATNAANSELKSSGHIPSLREKMAERLKAARFRYINEILYTSSGNEAQKMFKDDPEAFIVYHQGYQGQLAKWPIVPVIVIIDDIKKMSHSKVIADFGCGDARLARSVPQKVHSFDFVAINKHVVACNMVKVPLSNASVDVAVFCLSLMGTNLPDFLMEANRVLKMGGKLKIAEVESRFDNVENFAAALEKMGFSLQKMDKGHKMFIMMEFTKVRNASSDVKVRLFLQPCLYKKRVWVELNGKTNTPPIFCACDGRLSLTKSPPLYSGRG